MCGSWQKLSLGKSGSLPARMRGAVCAFDRQLYVMGGEKSITGPWYRVLWASISRRWTASELPDCLLLKLVTDGLVGYHLIPRHDGRAFALTGIPALPVLDTKRRRRSIMHTTFEPLCA
ncbi:hypothetical protein B0H17DRAFT_507042 [Mycena rosella]|uniref:Uncharacterized protein n=1 Tax=Mycena rosella TaxID=1033263 RepID=A0AAD7C0I2_MYCRO|nr:hypothetical protein B0H17DRAFT_507042 [Mycena rosella]